MYCDESCQSLKIARNLHWVSKIIMKKNRILLVYYMMEKTPGKNNCKVVRYIWKDKLNSISLESNCRAAKNTAQALVLNSWITYTRIA